MFAWREDLVAGVRLAITDRTGGVSAAPYTGLNLADHVGDDPRAVATNRRLLAGALDVDSGRLVFGQQVHGADVAVVDRPWAGAPARVDALVTRRRGLTLAVCVADCTPALLADPETGIVAVAHVGRRGLVSGVVEAVVAQMRELGARRISAWVGPSICPRCYEVPTELREEVAARIPVSRAVTRTGGPGLDVAAGVVELLAGDGCDVRWLPGCSAEATELFSYRRDGTTGRYAALVSLLPSPMMSR